MTKALITRIRRLESTRGAWHQPRIIYVRPPEGMTPDQVEAHRREVREAADDPRSIFIVYRNMGGSDSLDELMGTEEAEAINRRHREIALQRSYGNV